MTREKRPESSGIETNFKNVEILLELLYARTYVIINHEMAHYSKKKVEIYNKI